MCNQFFKICFRRLYPLPGLLLLSFLASCGVTGDGETGANPGVEDFPIAYVKRVIPVDDEGEIIQPDIRQPLESMSGGDVYLKTRSTIGAEERNITASITNGMGDVRDLDVSYDGKKLVFSLLYDPDPDDNIDPRWDIYIYDRTTGEVPQRVIASDITAAEGDDISPHFLPDGRIVFSSNRQSRSRAILLDEFLNKPQFSSMDENNRTKALVLHVMNADGTNIQQISFNQSHDLDPTVLSDGRILFSRWDRMFRSDSISLYTILPDGSDLQPYFGVHEQSHVDENDNTIQFTQPRVLDDGRIMVLARPYDDTYGGGDVLIIDAENFIDADQPVATNQGSMTTSAIEKATLTQVNNDGGRSLEGRYSSLYPLHDGSQRILLSKGLCQVSVDVSLDPAVPELETRPCIEPYLTDAADVATFPAYGIWLYNRNDDTEKPIVLAEPGLYINDVVAMQPATRPAINQGKSAAELDDSLLSEGVGLLNIRSVYDFGNGDFNGCFRNLCTDADVTDLLSMGDPAQVTADQRPARFIRIVKAVGLPSRRDPDLADPPNLSNRAFGRARRLGMKEIIGYAPIQPDGSVIVKVPANIAFYFDILDKDARRIGSIRHENWLQINAGDTLKCTGCHTHPRGDNAPLPLPHGRRDAEPPSIYTGAPSDGFIYPNTENPVTQSPYFANEGETMAEVLYRSQAVNDIDTAITPSVNVNYSDVWTDPDIRAPDAAFSYDYTGSNGLQTQAPVPSACETEWDATCRIVINYIDHIQPIWELDRPTGACISCHATQDAAGVAMVPAGQLDLTGDVSDEEGQHIESYRELFFNDNYQELAGGVLVDRLVTVPAVDDNGDPILDDNGVQLTEQIPDPDLELPPSMSINGARYSYFMEKMTETELNAGRALSSPTVSHANMLTSAELRLIAEWIDIGGQYFNDPFDSRAPQN